MSRHALRTAATCALAAFTLAAGCSDDTPQSAPFVCTSLSTECTGEAPSYANVVAPIIESSCTPCHYQGNPDGIWPLTDLAEVADWSSTIQPMLVDCLMPPRDSDIIMTDADREAFNAWLVCGTPDN